MRLFFSLLIFVFIGFAIIFIGKLANPPQKNTKIVLEKIPDLTVKDFFLDNQTWTLKGKTGYYEKEKSMFIVEYPYCIVERANKYIFKGDIGNYYIKTDMINFRKNVEIYIKDYIYYLDVLDFNMKTNKFKTDGNVKILIKDTGEILGKNLIGNTNIEFFRLYSAKGNLKDLKFESEVASFLFKTDRIVLREKAKIFNKLINAKAKTIILKHNKGEVKDVILTKNVFFKFKEESKIDTAKSVSALVLQKEEKLHLYDNVKINFKNGDKINGKNVIIDLKTGDIDIKDIKGSLNIKELGLDQ